MKLDCKNNNRREALGIKQKYSLSAKIELSKIKIAEWYEYHNGMVYLSFSGGKDSQVLLMLARSMFPDIPAVFFDTGLEFPEIRDHVKKFDNVEWIRPKMTFKQVIDKYGFPLINKRQAHYFHQVLNQKSEKNKKRILTGYMPNGRKTQFVISEKWKPLLYMDIKISGICCDIMKKAPAKNYQNRSGRLPFIGSMATESNYRKMQYIKNGCNAFNLSNPVSNPLSFWNESDVWEYVNSSNMELAAPYYNGHTRTGCLFCGLGAHCKGDNRFELLKQTHPVQHDYIMNKLGMGKALAMVKAIDSKC